MEHRRSAEVAELHAFLQNHPQTTHPDAFVIDLSGNAIGKRVPRSQMEKLYTAGTPLCAAMQLVDVLGNTADPLGHGFSDGDPDAFAVPVSGMLAPVPQTGPGRAQVLCEYQSANDRAPLQYEPRHVLEQVAARFSALGVKPVVAVELGFYFIEAERDGAVFPGPRRRRERERPNPRERFSPWQSSTRSRASCPPSSGHAKRKGYRAAP